MGQASHALTRTFGYDCWTRSHRRHGVVVQGVIAVAATRASNHAGRPSRCPEASSVSLKAGGGRLEPCPHRAIYEIGEVDDSIISHGYLPGGSLHRHCTRDRSRPSPARLCSRSRGVQHATTRHPAPRHQPHNVLLQSSDTRGWLLFGLELAPRQVARTATDGCDARLSDFGWPVMRGVAVDHGEALGTPSYMPPEQARATGNVGRAVDVSLALTLQLLTGRLPSHRPRTGDAALVQDRTGGAQAANPVSP